MNNEGEQAKMSLSHSAPERWEITMAGIVCAAPRSISRRRFSRTYGEPPTRARRCGRPMELAE